MSGLLSGLTGLDYAIVAILFFSLLFGLVRGFAKEVISLLAWVLAFFAALKFSPEVDDMLHSVITHPVSRYVVSLILIFFVVILLGCLVNKIVHAVLKFTGFGFFDRLLGLIFGLARGALIVTAVLLALSLMPAQNAVWAKDSKLSSHFSPLVNYFSAQLPTDLKALKSASLVVRQLLATNYVHVAQQLSDANHAS